MALSAPQIATGKTCVWYPNANRSEEPRAALVTRGTGAGGMVSLVHFTVGVLQGTPVENVRHVDDDYFKGRPKLASNTGGWDYVDGDKPAVAVGGKLEPHEERIVALFKELGPGKSREIAERLNKESDIDDRDWTYQAVNGVLNRLGLM